MSLIARILAPASLIAVGVVTAAPVYADDDGSNGRQNAYVVTPLVSDQMGQAPVMDPNLKNSWGVAFSPGASPFWISDNATGLSTLYDGDGTIVNLPNNASPVVIPCPPQAGQGSACPANASPTGMVWNASSAFLVPGTKSQASFLWATEDGTISAWTGGLTPANDAVLAVDNSVKPNPTSGAVYKGLVFGTNVNGVFLFATNFRAGTVDVFDHNYNPATTDGGFADPRIPPGFAPFGIENIDGDLFVTYAKQNAAKHDDVAGQGNGFVGVFDTDGHLLRRFASRGPLNSPWGIARASFAFGQFSGDVLVGNFGNGQINAFDSDGNFLGTLRDGDGKPISIDGLWKLTLGGGAKSRSDTLYFTAGPNMETDGLFGTVTPASSK
jgi:uncharacterized protein (TIGR03118 family)